MVFPLLFLFPTTCHSQQEAKPTTLSPSPTRSAGRCERRVGAKATTRLYPAQKSTSLSICILRGTAALPCATQPCRGRGCREGQGHRSVGPSGTQGLLWHTAGRIPPPPLIVPLRAEGPAHSVGLAPPPSRFSWQRSPAAHVPQPSSRSSPAGSGTPPVHWPA